MITIVLLVNVINMIMVTAPLSSNVVMLLEPNIRTGLWIWAGMNTVAALACWSIWVAS